MIVVEVENARFILEDLAHDIIYISSSPLTERILFLYWFEDLGVHEIAERLNVKKQFVRTVLSRYRSKYSSSYMPLFLRIYKSVKKDVLRLYRLHPSGNLSCNLCGYSTPENLFLANHFSIKHYDIVYGIIAEKMKIRIIVGENMLKRNILNYVVRTQVN